jgi:methionyl-tRNA synthetase
VHERPVEWIEEPSWFFRLSKYQQPLLDLYRDRPDFILPASRRNEIVSFVESGLKDLSVSRTTLRWGIPVPDDPSHVVYVWFDALANYVSALGYGTDNDALYTLFWKVGAEKSGRLAHREEKAPASGLPAHPLHLVGKDILRFHSVYWPAFLMAAGEPVPGTIFAHGWWLADEKKMSKTIGNVVRPGPILRTVGAEPLRWFLLREMTFGLDGTYSDEALIERVNADLANTLGNLLSRVVTLIARRPGRVLAPRRKVDPFPEMAALREKGRVAHERWIDAFERCEFSLALEAAIGVLAEVNRLLVVHQPWKDYVTPEGFQGDLAEPAQPGADGRLPAWAVLFEAASALRMAAVWLAPVCPKLARGLWAQLGLGGDPGAPGVLDSIRWEDCPALVVRPGDPLFPRLDKNETLAALRREIETENAPMTETGPPAPGAAPAAAPAPSPAPAAEAAAIPGVALIGIEQFQSVELRVGRITACEKVPKADKLLKLQVDIGTETRQIVSGIAESYTSEALIGRAIVVVVNLKPAVLRGVESRGMLLAADAGGRVSIVTFDDPAPAPGTRVK